jgi:hypothetical protein
MARADLWVRGAQPPRLRAQSSAATVSAVERPDRLPLGYSPSECRSHNSRTWDHNDGRTERRSRPDRRRRIGSRLPTGRQAQICRFARSSRTVFARQAVGEGSKALRTQPASCVKSRGNAPKRSTVPHGNRKGARKPPLSLSRPRRAAGGEMIAAPCRQGDGRPRGPRATSLRSRRGPWR